MQQERKVRKDFARKVFRELRSDDEENRWKYSLLVEELILWEPKIVPEEILENMSKDKSFSVRSSAAVCYYYLSALEPASVPLDLLEKLAAYDEDWYVNTPATSALLRLARTRPVVLDILAKNLEHEDASAREFSAAALKRLAKRDWDLISEDLIAHMMRSSDLFLQEVGKECRSMAKNARKEPQKDYSLF
jgi:predicted nucleic acid-binding protein